MNDKFLYQQRPAVRKEFADKLYHQLTQQEGKGQPMKTITNLSWKFALALVLGLTILVAIPGPVQASVLQWIRTIGGFTVEETQTAPTFAPNPTVYAYTPQPLPDALQGLPFTFDMPAYIPDGYLLSDSVVVAESEAWIALQWANTDGQQINLVVQQDWDLQLPAGFDSAEEVQINDEPALLLRGWWSEDGSGTWDMDRNVVQLYWRHANLIYSFEFWNLPADGNQDTFVQELIQVAESVP